MLKRSVEQIGMRCPYFEVSFSNGMQSQSPKHAEVYHLANLALSPKWRFHGRGNYQVMDFGA
eukprot:1679554-Karenia_brevis.AAC.1